MSCPTITKKLINQVSNCELECNEGLVAVNPGLCLVEGHNVVIRSDVSNCELECNEGLVAVNPGLCLVEGHNVVIRSDVCHVVSDNHVIIISGGGSGHEPGHGGFTGKGMLTACAFGSVFASPPPKTIMAAIDAACQGKSGCQVLMIVTNYTGDRLNFGIACERARAKGNQVEMVVVGEDCALESVDLSAGRRGLAGTILIHKIAGAMAEQGRSLSEMVTELNLIKEQMGTIGLSLSSCSVPGCGPMFELQSDEMELGLGVHGEAGVKRIKIDSAHGAVKTMMEHMTNPKTSTNLPLKSGDRVVVLINNLGGTSILELNVVAREAIYYLEEKGVMVERAYCGSYLTSLEMAGVSISVLHITDEILAYLDFPTEAPGWRPSYLPPGHKTRVTPDKMKVITGDNVLVDTDAEKLSSGQAQVVHAAIKKVCDSLISMEGHLNDLDRQSGDGDCGSTIARGATAIKTTLDPNFNPSLPIDCPHALALRIAQEAEDSMGGSSGALYSLFFTGVASELKAISPQSLSAAWKAGLDAVMKYGGARPGQRTMIDPLNTAWKCFDTECQSKGIKEAIKMASEVADRMSKETTKMDAQAGRASYVNKELLTKPDPGAVAVAVWIKAIADAI